MGPPRHSGAPSGVAATDLPTSAGALRSVKLVAVTLETRLRAPRS
eukprot:gene8253-39582_t